MIKIIILGDFEINYVKFGLSVVLIIYYVGYLFRLIYGCCKKGNNKISNISN